MNIFTHAWNYWNAIKTLSFVVLMYMLRCISYYFWFTEMLWIPIVRNSKLGTTYHSLKIWGHFLQDVIWLLQQVYLNLGPQLVMLNRFLYKKSKVLYIYYQYLKKNNISYTEFQAFFLPLFKKRKIIKGNYREAKWESFVICQLRFGFKKKTFGKVTLFSWRMNANSSMHDKCLAADYFKKILKT